MTTKVHKPTKIKLSFVIPTRNRPHELRQCLNSIISEIHPYDFPIYISDNASEESKNTKKVFDEVNEVYPHIYWHRFTENVGFDRNILHCMKMADSEYIWLFGDDDLLLPNAVKKVLSLLDTDQQKPACLIANWQQRADEFSTVRRDNCLEILEDKVINDHNEVLTKYGSFALPFVSCLILCREKITTINYEKYVGSDLVHVFILLEVIIKENTVLVADILLWQRVAVSNLSFIDTASRILTVEMLKCMLLLPDNYDRHQFVNVLSGINSHFQSGFKNQYIKISALYLGSSLSPKDIKDLIVISMTLKWYLMTSFCVLLYLTPKFILRLFYLILKKLK